MSATETSKEFLKFKLSQISLPIQGSTFDMAYLKKIFDVLSELHEEAVNYEINKLLKRPTDTQESYDALIADVKKFFRLSVQINGSKGEYIYSEDSSIFDEAQLPTNISSITIDNFVRFNNVFKSNPRNWLKIQLDFRKHKVLDLISNPSEATANFSQIQITAENDTWASAVNQKVRDLLEECKNGRDWLHATSIYDAFVFFFFLPIDFWALFRIEKAGIYCFLGSSNIILVAINVYLFFLILQLFRTLFNYSRWTFPKFEIQTISGRGSMKHRAFFSLLASGLFISFLYDLIKYVFKN